MHCIERSRYERQKKRTHDDRTKSILCKCAHVSVASIVRVSDRLISILACRIERDNSKDFIYLDFSIRTLGKPHQLPNFKRVQSLPPSLPLSHLSIRPLFDSNFFGYFLNDEKFVSTYDSRMTSTYFYLCQNAKHKHCCSRRWLFFFLSLH